MVFSVNAVESGSNTFNAFQARAMQINGSSSNNSSGNGALRLDSGAGIALALVSVVLALVL